VTEDNDQLRREITVSLRDYMDKLIEENKHYSDIRFQAINEAIVKADAAQAYRFESVNEFRGLWNDIVRDLITRREVEIMLVGLNRGQEKHDERLTVLELNQSNVQGRISTFVFIIGLGLSVVGVISRFI